MHLYYGYSTLDRIYRGTANISPRRRRKPRSFAGLVELFKCGDWADYRDGPGASASYLFLGSSPQRLLQLRLSQRDGEITAGSLEYRS